MRRKLYALTIPRGAQLDTTATEQRELSERGILGPGPAAVDAVASQAASYRLEGQVVAPTYAAQVAAEFEELFAADGYRAVPLFATGGNASTDGWYALRDVDSGPATAKSDEVHDISGRLVRAGTNDSHWRTVRLIPSSERTVENDFGSDTDQEVAAPAAASDVQWFDDVTGETEAASSTATRTTEGGDVDIYDPTAPSIDARELLFTIDYSDVGGTDCLVWDTRGRSYSDTTPAGDTIEPAWQYVFSPAHVFDGDAVLENGYLRLTFDFAGGLTAERWSTGSYGNVSLGSSTWEPSRLDIVEISPAELVAQVQFVDTSDSSTYTLDLSLQRGATDALWTRPASETSATPSGLQTYLGPIAATTDRNPRPATTIRARSDTRP